MTCPRSETAITATIARPLSMASSTTVCRALLVANSWATTSSAAYDGAQQARAAAANTVAAALLRARHVDRDLLVRIVLTDQTECARRRGPVREFDLQARAGEDHNAWDGLDHRRSVEYLHLSQAQMPAARVLRRQTRAVTPPADRRLHRLDRLDVDGNVHGQRDSEAGLRGRRLRRDLAEHDAI